MSDEITRRTFIGTTAIVVLGLVVDAQRAAVPAGLDRKTLTAAVDCIIPGGRDDAAGVGGRRHRVHRAPRVARTGKPAQQFSRALAALGAGSGYRPHSVQRVGAAQVPNGSRCSEPF